MRRATMLVDAVIAMSVKCANLCYVMMVVSLVAVWVNLETSGMGICVTVIYAETNLCWNT